MVNLFHPPAPRLPPRGCFVIRDSDRKFLPVIDVDAHATVLSASSRTTLTQTFINPDSKRGLDEVRYDFPLYDGVTVVNFVYTVGDRKIEAVVKERQAARKMYKDAASRGETAGLLEQSFRASDVFTASIGNVPAGEKVKVEMTYLGELEHDAEADAVRLTIPTTIAPRYDGNQVLGTTPHSTAPGAAEGGGRISITVDAEMADGCFITNVHSPSHPISVNTGKTSTATSKPSSPQRASATLALGTSKLEKDFVIMIVADGLGSPTAILETHPDLQRRALMATLVPRFNLPVSKPEVVFVCDRSGSMGDGQKIPNLVAALQIFLKSLPVGVRFNVCSFGSRFTFLWENSQFYDQSSLDKAVQHVKSFEADYGGTEIYQPLEEAFRRRLTDMNLEVFLLTDGEIWEQNQLFSMIHDHVAKSAGAIRVFTLGVGDEASSALIQGVARAGNGFAQKVAENEKMDKKVIRMLKGALAPHINDCALEIQYQGPTGDDRTANDEDFEVVEKVDCLSIGAEQDDATASKPAESKLPKKPILFYDPDVKDDEMEMTTAPTCDDNGYNKLPEVASPRYLQAPFKIPALFPFNRATVYVMLSASTPSREIKSVVLTGMSAHGPLRLEVPVTKLAEKGTTIHQLAARKAIQELEENGGWIAHAEDNSGKLLREEFAAHFDEMIAREGARLGVEYRVGGKWCSFVAVKETESRGPTNDEEAGTLGEFEVVRAEDLEPPQAMFGASAPRNLQMFAAATPTSSSGSLFGGAAPMAMCASMPMSMMHSKPAPPPAAAPVTFGSSSYVLNSGDDEDTRFGLLDDGLAPLRGKNSTNRPRLLVGGGAPSSVHLQDEGAQGEGMSDHSDPLTGLASLQTFIGSWKWSPELEKILDVTQKTAAEMQLPTDSVGQAEILATLCAVVFLRTRLADQKDAWEMMVEKSEGWLGEQTGETAARLEKMVEDAGLFGSA
ncbi:vault protein inter-alpha-trypsin domain-containing protein [Hirsutella rhossiliensis]|uniref:Vault protein inter-alpha-trypsin domain-containing protein n=1 Tax=Hirsutella rhossiliensis TaxID=111463 RepID=A0A9P8MPT3_9HYPO|nr:vault protein inter-alpha-trypsin domain-containing protein [Hirsutella rhossiliensis]KAH0959065.1 vault protein inter-alpha-trypsin domain-containing protein [Hirsutella rhossiliensis]